MTITKIPRGHYLSERKGLLKLSAMNVFHIKRAIIKRQKDLLGKVYDPDESPEEFLVKMRSISRDRIINVLKRELRKRS
jgi:hypothetical protein